jgi:hypothetical protein
LDKQKTGATIMSGDSHSPLTLDESIFLAAILVLEDGAYGVAIRRKVLEMAGKSVSNGTLCSHLAQIF